MKDLIIIEGRGALTPQFAGSGNVKTHNPYPFLAVSDRLQAMANYRPFLEIPTSVIDKKI